MAQAAAGDGRAFAFLKLNQREPKKRRVGVTEIRGPYYTPMGKRYLQDVLETMGAYVDALKFAGGSFALMPRAAVAELVELCHRHTSWSRPAASSSTSSLRSARSSDGTSRSARASASTSWRCRAGS